MASSANPCPCAAAVPAIPSTRRHNDDDGSGRRRRRRRRWRRPAIMPTHLRSGRRNGGGEGNVAKGPRLCLGPSGGRDVRHPPPPMECGRYPTGIHVASLECMCHSHGLCSLTPRGMYACHHRRFRRTLRRILSVSEASGGRRWIIVKASPSRVAAVGSERGVAAGVRVFLRTPFFLSTLDVCR